MSLRNMEVQYVGDTLFLSKLEREVKHIIVKDEDVKYWKHFEPVVRCRDCKFSRKVEWPEWMNVPSDYLDCHGELAETWDYYNDEPNKNPVKPDGFCAWGEKTNERNVQ